MSNEMTLEALKGGIKGELDSINLYQKAYEEAADPEVKKFFGERVEEEKRHYNYLLNYYTKLDEGVSIDEIEQQLPDTFTEVSPIITPRFIEAIAASKILFSSLSTAALLEKNAIDYYRDCARQTTHNDLKIFFELMVKWETQHYEDIMKIQKDAEEQFWNVNRFEPF